MVQAGTRRLLRFTTETRNVGNADLYLGNPAGNPLFEYTSCHGHYHFSGYVTQRLLNSRGQAVASGLKIGFCLRDSSRWDPSANAAVKYICTDQGIQHGWTDIYVSELDGQWIDITGLPAGTYRLELTVNPVRRLIESSYGNNTVSIPVTIPSSLALASLLNQKAFAGAPAGEPDEGTGPAQAGQGTKVNGTISLRPLPPHSGQGAD